MRWLESTDRQSQHASIITLAEIQKGIELWEVPYPTCSGASET